MILYIENPNNSTKKWTDLINEFSKPEGSKANIKISHLSIHLQWTFRKRHNFFPFTAPKTRKYWGINFNIMIKLIYNRNYKAVIKEIKKDRWKVIHVHGLEELILLKWQDWWNPSIYWMYSQLSCQRCCFTELKKKKKKALLKFVWNHKVAGDLCLTPGLGRFPGGGNGSLFWFSCLEKISWTEEAWQATVHRVRHDWLSNWAQNTLNS